MTTRTLALALLIALMAELPFALATAPYSNWPSDVWTRTDEGEVVYAAVKDDHLSALCVQIGNTSSWLPKELLADITLPKLAEVKVVHGVGLSRVEEFLPGRELGDLSVQVDSAFEEKGVIREGPEYFFVLQRGRPVFRVRQQWVPVPDQPGTRVTDEKWVPIDRSAVRSAPCRPPQ